MSATAVLVPQPPRTAPQPNTARRPATQEQQQPPRCSPRDFYATTSSRGHRRCPVSARITVVGTGTCGLGDQCRDDQQQMVRAKYADWLHSKRAARCESPPSPPLKLSPRERYQLQKRELAEHKLSQARLHQKRSEFVALQRTAVKKELERAHNEINEFEKAFVRRPEMTDGEYTPRRSKSPTDPITPRAFVETNQKKREEVIKEKQEWKEWREWEEGTDAIRKCANFTYGRTIDGRTASARAADQGVKSLTVQQQRLALQHKEEQRRQDVEDIANERRAQAVAERQALRTNAKQSVNHCIETKQKERDHTHALRQKEEKKIMDRRKQAMEELKSRAAEQHQQSLALPQKAVKHLRRDKTLRAGDLREDKMHHAEEMQQDDDIIKREKKAMRDVSYIHAGERAARKRLEEEWAAECARMRQELTRAKSMEGSTGRNKRRLWDY